MPSKIPSWSPKMFAKPPSLISRSTSRRQITSIAISRSGNIYFLSREYLIAFGPTGIRYHHPWHIVCARFSYQLFSTSFFPSFACLLSSLGRFSMYHCFVLAFALTISLHPRARRENLARVCSTSYLIGNNINSPLNEYNSLAKRFQQINFDLVFRPVFHCRFRHSNFFPIVCRNDLRSTTDMKLNRPFRSVCLFHSALLCRIETLELLQLVDLFEN